MNRFLVAVVLLGNVMARAQNPQTLDGLAQRLELLERQNADLLAQIRSLRSELETVKGATGEPAPPARVEALEQQAQLQARSEERRVGKECRL